MSLLLFGQNLIESAAAVAVSNAPVAGKDLSRIYDRDRSLQYIGGSVAQTDIDVDLGSALPVSALAFLNHNIVGVTVSIRADSSSPAATERATLIATGADVIVAVNQVFRYWRVRIPVMAVAPQIGELLLGVPRVISQSPFYKDSSGVKTLGNVKRAESAGGFIWGVRLGSKRAAMSYSWPALSPADRALLEAAYDDVAQGAKHLLVRDPFGALRWMCWMDPSLEPKPLANGKAAMSMDLQEAL